MYKWAIFLVFDKSFRQKQKIMNPGLQPANIDITESIGQPRRRRTPSRYASSIRELTKMHSRSSKKQRSQSSVEDQIPLGHASETDRNETVQCILPGKFKKLKLSVIIRKQPKPQTKPKKVVNTPSPIVQQAKEKQCNKKNNSLLDKLLEAVQKLQDDQNCPQKNDTHQQPVATNQQQHKREYKLRKQKEEEQKYLRYYQKYQVIMERLEDIEKQLVLI